jgi:hypothetical protein
MDYCYLAKLTNNERLHKMLANLQQGNHKSAQDKSDQVAKLLKKDLDHGFAWIIPKHLVPLIPQSMVQPLGLAKQWTMNKNGERIPKYRLTQDLSFKCAKGTKGMSVNSQIKMKVPGNDIWVVHVAHPPLHHCTAAGVSKHIGPHNKV